jgi:adenylate cyclase
MLRLRTLGGLSLYDGEAPRGGVAAQRKALALLALLAIAGPRGLSRDKLVAYLWPESPADRATHRLTQLIYSVRRDLEAEDLFFGSIDLRLNAGIITTDVARFTAALEAGDFEGAAAAYGGPFLDGFFLSDAAEFDQWLEQERARLAQRHVSALESLARAATARGDLTAAVGRWQELTQTDPLNARITIGYMEALSAAGDRAGALRFARSHEALMRAEFDTEPDPAVVAVVGRLRNPAPATATPAIAVLPFVNLTPERGNEYFSDGMTEELTNALTQVPGLRVTSRTSACTFKGSGLDARQIADRLGVTALVEGSVRMIGNRIRLVAQLVNAADGCHLWSATYDRTLADVFALQEELSQAIVAALPVPATTIPRPLVQPPTRALDAYTLYLRGRYAALKRTVEGLSLGIEYFEQALEKDKGYALAQAGLAECWLLRGFQEFGDLEEREAMPRGKAAALEAVRLDPRLSPAHTWLGVAHLLYDWDWTAAESEFRRAIQLQPENAYAQLWYAVFLGAMGRHDESLRQVHGAESLDPLALAVQLTVARCYYFARRYPEALAYLEGILRAEPEHPLVTIWLARTLCAMGRHADVLHVVEAVPISQRGPNLIANAALALAWLGQGDEARTICRDMGWGFGATKSSRPPPNLASIHALLGDADMAYATLEHAFQRRSSFLPFVLEPVLDPARRDPRARKLIARLGLSE